MIVASWRLGGAYIGMSVYSSLRRNVCVGNAMAVNSKLTERRGGTSVWSLRPRTKVLTEGLDRLASNSSRFRSSPSGIAGVCEREHTTISSSEHAHRQNSILDRGSCNASSHPLFDWTQD